MKRLIKCFCKNFLVIPFINFTDVNSHFSSVFEFKVYLSSAFQSWHVYDWFAHSVVNIESGIEEKTHWDQRKLKSEQRLLESRHKEYSQVTLYNDFFDFIRHFRYWKVFKSFSVIKHNVALQVNLFHRIIDCLIVHIAAETSDCWKFSS